MNKSALQVSLDSGLMALLGKAQKSQDAQIQRLKRRIEEQNDELRSLRPLRAKVNAKVDLDALRAKYERHGRAIYREAGRTLNALKALEKRTVGGLTKANRWTTPSDLVAARRALAKVLKSGGE